MIRALFRYWPRAVGFWSLFLGCIVFDTCVRVITPIYIRMQHLAPDLPAVQDMYSGQGFLTIIALFGAAVWYGVYRVVWYHPICRSSYYEWLSSTPYDGTQPLPLGPPTFTLSDVTFWLALQCPLLFVRDIPYTALLRIMAVSYLIGNILVAYLSENDTFVVLVLVTCGALVETVNHSIVSLLVTVALLVYSQLVLRRGLRRFPWSSSAERFTIWHSLNSAEKSRPFEGETSRPHLWSDKLRLQVGWPLYIIGPGERPDEVTYPLAAIIAIATGLYIHGIATLYPKEMLSPRNSSGLVLVALAFGAFGALLRLVLYWKCTRLPSSLVHMILRGKIFDPKFFRVFMGPIATVATSWLVSSVMVSVHADLATGYAISLAVSFFVLLASPPSYNSWMLRGEHQISRRSVLFQKLRQI